MKRTRLKYQLILVRQHSPPFGRPHFLYLGIKMGECWLIHQNQLVFHRFFQSLPKTMGELARINTGFPPTRE